MLMQELFLGLGLEGWIYGATGTAIVISAMIFGLINIIKGAKSSAKLLLWAGLICFCIGSFWLGPTVEFIFFLLNGTHIEFVQYCLLSYTLIAPGVIAIGFIGGELIAPKFKQGIVVLMVIAGIVFEYFLWFFTIESFKPEETPLVGHILDAGFNTGFYTFFLIAFFLVYIFLFMATGFAIKAKKATGELRKKFIYLSLAFYIFVIAGVFDALISFVLPIAIMRIIMLLFAPFMYLGLKT